MGEVKLIDLFVFDHDAIIQLFEYDGMITVNTKTPWISNFHWSQLTKTSINIYTSLHTCPVSHYTLFYLILWLNVILFNWYSRAGREMTQGQTSKRPYWDSILHILRPWTQYLSAICRTVFPMPLEPVMHSCVKGSVLCNNFLQLWPRLLEDWSVYVWLDILFLSA